MQDAATGLQLKAARWYSPDLGRFLSTDPIEDGSNWYAFAGNDPVNYADPSGLSASFHPLGNSTLAPAYINSKSILSSAATNLNLSGSYLAGGGLSTVADPFGSYGGQFNAQPINLGLGARSATSTSSRLANLPTAPYGGNGLNLSSGFSPTSASPLQWQRSLGAAAPVAPAPDLGGVDGRLLQTIREQAARDRFLSPPPTGFDGNFVVTAPPHFPTISAETRTSVQLNADRQRAYQHDVRASAQRIIGGRGTSNDLAYIQHYDATRAATALDTYYALEAVVASFVGVPGTRPGVNASRARQGGGGLTPRNAHLAGSTHPATGIPFSRQGFPDFSGVAIKTVKIQQVGNYTSDYTAANKAAGLKSTPTGYTWHHHQDGRTMQLVPTPIHDATGHTGGVAVKKATGGK